jgi:sulfur carrier protein ThiS
MEVPEDVNVKRLIDDFSIAANAIAAVVNVEQVIKDTPR